MDKTLFFYKPIISFNDIPTTMHITSILDVIASKTTTAPQELLKVVNRKNTAIKRVKVYDQGDNNPLDRGFSIAKYRENKPFTGNRHSHDIGEIDDDVMELTNCVYFEGFRILCIEYNHNGIRANAIRDYLSSFLPVTETEHWSLQLHQIENDEELRELRNSMQLKSIRFTINPEATQFHRNNTLNTNDTNDEISIFNSLIDASLDAIRILGGTNEIFLKKKSSVNEFDFATMMNILDGLNIDGGLFNNVYVTYRPLHSRKDKTINLIQSGFLKHTYQTDNTGWESICDEINNIFFENGRIGSNKPSSAPPLTELVETNEPEII